MGAEFSVPLALPVRQQADAIGPVLVIVHRVIGGWLAGQAGGLRETPHYGAVTLIQRFGSAHNFDAHFHMLWLDGVYEGGVSSNCSANHPASHPRPDHRAVDAPGGQERASSAGIWRAIARSKAKTNRSFCPTARVATTAWTYCG
jgi:hypothetical protein